MGQNKRILLVEDDAIIALLEKKWLNKEGFEVIYAASGEEAIGAVKSSPEAIDLILMDIDLGRGAMDGTDAAQIILKDHDIPLLFLSSHTEKEIVEKTEKISSYGYVVKGSDNAVLLASIKMAFKLFNANQRLAESNQYFEQMYLQSSISTQILDAEGWCVRINPKLSELFGVKPEDIEGRVYNIFNDDEIKRNGIDAILRNVFEKKESAQWEVYFDIGAAADSQHIKVEQKTKVWFKNKAWPILDKNGKLLNVVIQHENISEMKQMEELLRSNEKRLRNIFDVMSEGFSVLEVVCDEKGKPLDLLFLGINPAFAGQTGLSAAETAGKTLLQLFPAAESNWIEYCGKAGKTGEPVHFEAKLASSDRFFQVSAFQIEYCRIGILLRDVSHSRKAEEALRQSNELNKSLLQTIPFGMDIVDESGTVLLFNEIFEKKFGRGAIGKKCWELYREDKTQCEGCPLHSGIRIGETATMQTNASNDDIIYEISHTGLYFNGKKAMLEIFQDVTDRKKTEDQLKKYAEELKTASETKDKFFSILAHDLKGPFSGFLGLTEDLINNLRNLDEKEISEYAFILNSHAKRLYELLNDLLDWSMLQSGRMEFQPAQFNICNEVQNTIGLFYPVATAKSIFITNEVNINSIVYADQNMVSTILRNLISNSIKFTNEGGRIHITSKQNGDFLEISVSDTGIGITFEILDRIFSQNLLYSTRGTNNENGSGLGLVLCKELVRKNGGDIKVESQLKQGTIISFSLPLSMPV